MPPNNDEPVVNDVNPKLLLEFLKTTCDDTLIASAPYEPLAIVTSPNICVEPVIYTEPVNSCVSPESLPNLVDPDENKIEDDSYITCISVAEIVP